MVPQPVLAVLLLYPITKESEEANKKGVSRLCSSSSSNSVSHRQTHTPQALRAPRTDPWTCRRRVACVVCHSLLV